MKYLLLLVLVVIVGSCTERNKNNNVLAKDQNNKKEILIYCENVMVPALMELKEEFELKEECVIKLHNDCSQNLASLIQYSLKGDIYLPASKEGFKKLQGSSKSFIVDSAFIGFNPLVVMSLKGNPSQYSGNIKSLTERKYALIIANPETSSLGAETRKLLNREKIYEELLMNVVALTTDSRGLVKSLENNEAQLIINWQSDLYHNGNANEVDIFPIPEGKDLPSEIYAGILSTSNNADLARDFLNYATGENGISVFRKYGINRRKSLIF
ncbi:molybdate ABC transporter substrate-binding protein [Plebeiibacterium sediminum]|uniref:Molybdate ABC transporter substrate-binding protein n=1 Tax=Plebeiibacterium sediminum TaxID=2992112 RepID=A0AAE3M1K5_9BACT|nr:molybdate ABC transporter substrate-binding protein [Plebeiobacterium sediminum]MCW3785527.1 molybdate ABC transporter substrate-binding protein [Plebeiobacterium sediminum]